MTDQNKQLPARLVRVGSDPQSVDVKERTIESLVATRLLARDGGILLPEGIITRAFEGNPVVQFMHGYTAGNPVCGRCLALTVGRGGVVAKTQFADTDLGRELAYLYGCNDKGEVYMRAWSFGWTALSVSWIPLDEARKLLGADWDEELVPPMSKRSDEVWVCNKSEMLEYSAVPIGADREALSRAYGSGVRAAGELLTGLNLREANEAIADLRGESRERDQRLEKLESDLKVLRGKGAAAATPDNSADILEAIRACCAAARGKSQ